MKRKCKTPKTWKWYKWSSSVYCSVEVAIERCDVKRSKEICSVGLRTVPRLLPPLPPYKNINKGMSKKQCAHQQQWKTECQKRKNKNIAASRDAERIMNEEAIMIFRGEARRRKCRRPTHQRVSMEIQRPSPRRLSSSPLGRVFPDHGLTYSLAQDTSKGRL